jgi:ferritin
MRMPQELEEAFNDQIDMEITSSTEYLQMSA